MNAGTSLMITMLISLFSNVASEFSIMIIKLLQRWFDRGFKFSIVNSQETERYRIELNDEEKEEEWDDKIPNTR